MSRRQILLSLCIAAIILGMVAGIGISGCGAADIAQTANEKCAEHGGVQEIESNYHVIVCKDGTAVED